MTNFPKALDYENIEGQELTAAQNENPNFVFYWVEDCTNGSRYAIRLSDAYADHLDAERVANYNEQLPDAYACSECQCISSDLQEYGCSNCGNGEEEQEDE